MKTSISHKRSVPEVRPRALPLASTSSATSVSSSSSTWFSAWEQQDSTKRPRTGDYREPHGDDNSDDDDDDDERRTDESASNSRTKVELFGRLSLSGLDSNASDQDRSLLVPPQRSHSGQLRWILRRDSKSPSISSVVTEISEFDVASALTTSDTDAVTISRRTHGTTTSSAPPLDSLVRNMENWSLTHIRALRRNNLFDATNTTTKCAPPADTTYRQTVHAARRDVMRTLRRGSISSTVSVASTCSNNNVSSVESALRRGSTASLNSVKTV
jgi:hypothetical protein